MSNAFSISSIGSSATSARSSLASGRVTSAPSAQDLDAAIASVSPISRVSNRATQNALRTISDSASFINVASDAAARVSSTLDRISELSTELSSEVDQNRTTLLKAEIDQNFLQLDAIRTKAKFNDTSVVGAGSKSFSYDLNGSSLSSDTEFRLSVSDVAITRSDLGELFSGESDAFYHASSAERADALDKAKSQVSLVQKSLNNSGVALNDFAQSIGVSAAVRLQESSATEQTTPEELAAQIAASLKTRQDLDSNALDPLRVADLVNNKPAVP